MIENKIQDILNSTDYDNFEKLYEIYYILSNFDNSN